MAIDVAAAKKIAELESDLANARQEMTSLKSAATKYKVWLVQLRKRTFLFDTLSF